MKEPLKAPYVQELDKRGRLTVWIVDGAYIRGHVNEEFTNFAQHCQFDFIPENELWIDKATKPDDQEFFIANMLTMHRLIEKGVPFAKALDAAEHQEKKERRRAGDVAKLTDGGRKLPEGKDVHERLWQTMSNGVSVWIVNGRLVRSVFDLEFTEGGHDHVYEFVPEKEVWIDDDIEEDERPYVLVHELHERNLMEKGWTYRKAHADSSRLEFKCRHHPDELHDALFTEGWGH